MPSSIRKTLSKSLEKASSVDRIEEMKQRFEMIRIRDRMKSINNRSIKIGSLLINPEVPTLFTADNSRIDDTISSKRYNSNLNSISELRTPTRSVKVASYLTPKYRNIKHTLSSVMNLEDKSFESRDSNISSKKPLHNSEK